MRTATVLVMPLVCLSVLAVGCRVSPVTGERQLVLIDTQQEIALGREAAPQFEQEFGGRVADAELQAYVSRIGQSVAAQSERSMPYEFALLNSDTPNAFALPGGKVYITAGLMRQMENERELAAVLGHEVAHVAARHNVQALQRQLGASLLVQLAAAAVGPDASDAAATATQIVTGMAQLSYSRDQELEADRIGMRYMERAGYNPYGMIELLTTLNGLEGDQPGWSEFFRTHPLTDRRLDEALDTVQTQFASADPNQRDPAQDQFLRMRQRLA
ncbi:MAG: M48 family metalloprotease [Planctomycetes bacterium]|jgi:predicted Zn-dependent protease|nr:M48 family metalloprotease [Planctomycetota bacterium]